MVFIGPLSLSLLLLTPRIAEGKVRCIQQQRQHTKLHSRIDHMQSLGLIKTNIEGGRGKLIFKMSRQNYPNHGKAQNLQCHDFGPACYAIAHPCLLGWSWNWNWRNHFLLVLVLPSRAGRQEKVAKCSAVINIPTITTFTAAITIIQHFLLAPAWVSRWKDAMRLISCELQFVPDIILLIPHTLCRLNYLKQSLGDWKGCIVLQNVHCAAGSEKSDTNWPSAESWKETKAAEWKGK